MMKVLLLISLIICSQAFAAAKQSTYSCSIKGLLPASPEQFRLGDAVSISLDYIDTKENVFSKNTSEVDIMGLKVVGNVRYSLSGGPFPHAYEFVSDNRLLMIVEISKSGNNARLRSTTLSKPQSGIPVIANLSCVKL